MIERFNGLGQLSPAALRLLWDSRTAVTARQVALGAVVWRGSPIRPRRRSARLPPAERRNCRSWPRR